MNDAGAGRAMAKEVAVRFVTDERTALTTLHHGTHPYHATEQGMVGINA
jgi:hypothetical protein